MSKDNDKTEENSEETNEELSNQEYREAMGIDDVGNPIPDNENADDGNEDEEPQPKMTSAQQEKTVGAMIDFSGALAMKFKKVTDPSARAQYMSEYHGFCDPLLTMIGMGNALATMPVNKMKPSTVLLSGLGIMVVGAFLTAAPKVITKAVRNDYYDDQKPKAHPVGANEANNIVNENLKKEKDVQKDVQKYSNVNSGDE